MTYKPADDALEVTANPWAKVCVGVGTEPESPPPLRVVLALRSSPAGSAKVCHTLRTGVQHDRPEGSRHGRARSRLASPTMRQKAGAAHPATLLVYALLLGAATGYVTSDLFDPVAGVILGVLALLVLLGSVRHQRRTGRL